ncbi:MAG TPA: ester cyclase [Thermomicrobiales bacterium]|nr:ester cyclase [Thermomicrobiales bacterium]
MTVTTHAEAQKAVVRRFVDEFWSRGNLAAADEMMTRDAIIHEPVTGTPADLKAVAVAIRAAFPDWQATVEEMLVDGDRVAERWTGHGTHRGEFQGIPPTGKRVAVPGVVFYRIANGKIAEFRGQFDRMSLLQQLGVIPGATGPSS